MTVQEALAALERERALFRELTHSKAIDACIYRIKAAELELDLAIRRSGRSVEGALTPVRSPTCLDRIWKIFGFYERR